VAHLKVCHTCTKKDRYSQHQEVSKIDTPTGTLFSVFFDILNTRYQMINTMINILCALFLFASVILSAQEYTDQTPPDLREQWYAQHLEMKKQSLFNNLNWQFIGPTNISGRMTDVAVVEPKGENYTIYVAGATGGVWRTRNEGTIWEPIFEHGISTSIGDITIAPSNSDIIWIGTGEANIFRSSHAGAGVYKSTDGGDSWQHMGLTGTHTIPRIAIDPKDPDIVYVASSGHEWTDNEDRGLYKTTDGGKSWEKVLYIDERTGVIDLVMHPDNPKILYASTWQRIRRKWNDPRVEPGYNKSTIYKTTNGGKSWKEVSTGLVRAEDRGRIGIDICRSNPDVLYAFVDNYEAARLPEEGELNSYGMPKKAVIRGATVYRTDNGGDQWHQVSETNKYMETLSSTYGWVFGQIRVDPNDADRVYIMGLALNVSKDGGKTFKRIGRMHGDHHGLWIDPANSKYLVNVNDGGIAISYDGGKHFRDFRDDFPLVQFFNVSYDMDTPFNVIGSIQDHGSYMAPVDLSRGRHNIPTVEWDRAPGGEGTRHAIDPTDPDIVYASSFYGRLGRTDLSSEERTSILPKPDEGELPFRGQWLSATIISPHNPRVIYHGMNYLFRSMNQGDTWERISPDLTYNDPEKYGDIPYQTIFAIAESPFKFGTIYVGTDDGRIHRTTNSGADWTELTSNVPVHQWISKIVVSVHADSTLYLTQNGKRFDDFAAYVWKSTDMGETWEDISGNIPCGPVNAIAEDPKNPNVLYVGTDLGVYVTLDGGSSWQVLAADIPTTFVHDVTVHPGENLLIAATEGRGMYVMDIRFIQEMTDSVKNSALYVFEPDQAKLPRGWRRPWISGNIVYTLNTASDVTIAIIDEDGNFVRTLKHSGIAGINQVEWDLRADPEEEDGRGERVIAGTYAIMVEGNGEKSEVVIVVEN
jgi:photosystem II stability/assembly factor-like uncharacterized protein